MTWCNKFGILHLFNDILISILSILIPWTTLHEYSCLHLWHCIWRRCITNCIKDSSHGFLANRWLVYNLFMGLGNTLEVVVHHLLIGEMIGLGYWDGFPMVSALMCMVTHWVGPMVSPDLRLSSSHDLTKLLLCVISQPWVNIKLVLKFVVISFDIWVRL